MLATQVSYWNLQEVKRHNLATEEQAKGELAETQRHNRRAEELQGWSIGETSRHNQVAESQAWANLSELQRHNRQGEMQSYWNYLSDLGYKQSSVRQRDDELDIRRDEKDIRQQEADIKQSVADETKRHNEQTELLDWKRLKQDKDLANRNLLYNFWKTGSDNLTSLVGSGLRSFTNVFGKRSGFGGGSR